MQSAWEGKETAKHEPVSAAKVLWETVTLFSVSPVALCTFIQQVSVSVFAEPSHTRGTEAKEMTSI